MTLSKCFFQKRCECKCEQKDGDLVTCEDMKVKAVLHGPALCLVQREQVSSTAVSYVRLSPRSTRTHSHNFPPDSLPLSSLLFLTPSSSLPSSFWAENSASQFPISTSVSPARAVCALVMFCDPTSVEVEHCFQFAQWRTPNVLSRNVSTHVEHNTCGG